MGSYSDWEDCLWKTTALILGLVSAALGFLATLALMKGTAATPWEIQSWNGKSDPERHFSRLVGRWRLVGLILLASSFLTGALAAVAGYFS